MPRRISPSQLKSMIRQAEAKRKRAIYDYNQKVREYNRKVQRVVDDYNREVRAHNTRVRANRQRLRNALNRLQSQSGSSSILSSSQNLRTHFNRVEVRYEAGAKSEQEYRFLDLSERETANSVEVLNALDGRAESADGNQDRLGDTEVGDELRAVSPELDQRWRGALFALDPRNPDAARHFCTSAREIFAKFLELHAPDSDVLSAFPSCDRAHDGRPTRRMRIRLMLTRKAIGASEYEDFVAHDVDNIIELFKVFNDGTHGTSGKYTYQQLRAVKKRAEDGILFLASLV